MAIQKNSVVSIAYKLVDDAGNQLDASAAGEPLVYLHGSGNIISGLEEALEGRAKGEKVQVSIPPDKAYGVRHDQLVQAVPRDQFPNPGEISEGEQFHASTENGPMILTVVEVRDQEVVVDGNHPLAGQTLHFDVEIMDVRDATKEELDHGHAHGPKGHNH